MAHLTLSQMLLRAKTIDFRRFRLTVPPWVAQTGSKTARISPISALMAGYRLPPTS